MGLSWFSRKDARVLITEDNVGQFTFWNRYHKPHFLERTYLYFDYTFIDSQVNKYQ